MINLIKNELIKIFKRKTIYLLLFFSIILIVIYNNINPDQNEISNFNYSTNNIPLEGMQQTLESMNVDNIDEYIIQKSTIDFWKLYNEFEENSWQRYALKEEVSTHTINNVYTDYNLDIQEYLKIINDYEINTKSLISIDTYEKTKEKYNKYVSALNSNNWKEFISLKIQNLEERKNKQLLKGEIEEINFEIELYELRLNNNINFDNNFLNQYLEEYKINFYMLKLYENNTYNESIEFINKNINDCKSKTNICKYAIENNIEYDISNENNLIINNKIDARISFIRTFNHFDLIVVIIAIYISTTILTEETNRKTIKNLLTKPHKRSKILLSKIWACMITLIIVIIFIIISQYIIGGVIFGFDSYKIKYIGYDYNNEQIITMSLVSYVVTTALLKIPMYMIIVLFCIFIGVINNHTSMSMILTLIIFLISNTILVEWSKVESLSIITRYFITNNWDFNTYMFGQISDISGVTLFGSIINCLIHSLILLYLSITFFNKKEIVNF